jgi:O-antigen ligase
VFAAYMSEIMENVGTFLFGMGMGAGGLAKDPHNLYLEIAYYIGFVGLGLVIAYFGTLVRYFVKRSRRTENQNLLAKYAVLLMVLVLHLTLHGMFTLVTYAGFMLAFLSILLTKKKEAK